MSLPRAFAARLFALVHALNARADASLGSTKIAEHHAHAVPLKVKAACVAIAALPFLSIYLAHWLGGAGATGFVQFDQPYYCANGRAIFERGNGISHPNPFDPSANAPNIYFHWFTWLLGAGVTKFGFDPGAQHVVIGIAAGLLCSWLTFELVDAILPDRRHLMPLYFFTMWGGGLLCIASLAKSALAGESLLKGALCLDPGGGWWFLSWGRNLVYANEAVYHSLVALIWLSVFRRNWIGAALATGALAATHPFSGIQHLLIFCAWQGSLTLYERSLRNVRRLAIACLMLVPFCLYYFVFLESFEQHRRLRETWTLDWSLSLESMLFAYGPIFVPACLSLWSIRSKVDQRVWHVILSAVISFLLVKHDWFIKPHQPLHFTRGYVWMPLCLLALPWMQSALIHANHTLSRRLFGIVICIVGMFAVFDNSVFLAKYVFQQPGFYLTSGSREMFTWMNRHKINGILACPDADLSYLSAAYTSARPYYGHIFMTPKNGKRKSEVDALCSGGEEPPETSLIEYVLIHADQAAGLESSVHWRQLHAVSEWKLFQRQSRSAADLSHPPEIRAE